MSTQQSNEAAERLRDFVRAYVRSDQRLDLIDDALAAERRATVERIRNAYHGDKSHWFSQWLDQEVAILDEEAAR